VGDFWQGLHKGLGHFLGLHLPATKNEHPDFVPLVCLKSSPAVTNPVVLSEDNPSSFSNLRYPVFVLGVLGEMIVVDLHCYTTLAEFFRDYLLAQ